MASSASASAPALAARPSGGGEARVGEARVAAQRRRERGPLPLGRGRQEHPAVGRAVQPVQRAEPAEPVIDPAQRRAALVAGVPADQRLGAAAEHGRHQVGQRDAAPPRVQAEQEAGGHAEGGDAVGLDGRHGAARPQVARAAQQLLAVFRARPAERGVGQRHPRRGADGRRVGGLAAVRPVDAVAGRVEVDQVRVDRLQRGLVDADPRRDARPGSTAAPRRSGRRTAWTMARPSGARMSSAMLSLPSAPCPRPPRGRPSRRGWCRRRAARP